MFRTASNATVFQKVSTAQSNRCRSNVKFPIVKHENQRNKISKSMEDMQTLTTVNPTQTFKTIEIGDCDPGTIAKRLEWVRHYYGKSQKQFAAGIEILPTTYNSWLNGPHGLSLQGARRIKQVYNVSLDFLYFGDTSNLPDDIHQAWNFRPASC